MIGAAGAAQASVILNGAHLVTVDPVTGNWAGDIRSTTGCCAPETLYVGSIAPGNALATTTGASPDGYQDLNYILPEGTSHFVLFGDGGPGPNLGTDLYFNEPFGTGTVGASAPQITAYLNGSGSLSSGTAGATQPTFDYVSGSAPNGALTFTSGADTVTISNYQSFSSFDLTVTSSSATPEPGTISLVFAGAPRTLSPSPPPGRNLMKTGTDRRRSPFFSPVPRSSTVTENNVFMISNAAYTTNWCDLASKEILARFDTNLNF